MPAAVQPKPRKNVTVATRLSPAERAEATRQAARLGISLAAYQRLAVQQFMRSAR